jgi:atypical dual specificity phosphatase
MLCSFNWTIPGKLAGSGQPGLLAPIEDDMVFVREQGFGFVVTLTENPLRPDAETFGMRGLHFPIDDMGIATPREVDRVCSEIIHALECDETVLVHCRAGLGRTGMVLGCCLVALGMESEEALGYVRSVNARYVQTRAQEKLISHYASFVESQKYELSK